MPVVAKRRRAPTHRAIIFVLGVILLPSASILLGVHLNAIALTPPVDKQSIEVAYPISRIDVHSLSSPSSVEVLNLSRPLTLSVSRQSSVGPSVLASAGRSSVGIASDFEGLNEVQSCTCVPPDVQVAAGPNQVVEMVNVEGEIFTKQGVSNKTFSLSSFFLAGTDSISDPKILFDLSSGRWFASVVDINIRNVVVAVSNTSDAGGTWTIYRLSAGTFLPDQPIIGVSDDKFIASANDFRSTSFVGAKYWVLNKAQMLTGSAVSFFSSTVNSGFFSVHPVQSLSSTTIQYMVGNVVSGGALSSSAMELFSVTGVPGVSTVVTTTSSLAVSSLSIPPAGAEPGTTATIDTSDIRVQDALWYKGILWYGLDDGCTPAGDTQVRSCIRLTQIDTTTSPATVRQDFDYGSNGLDFFYPAMRVDGLGDLDLVYGFSSVTVSPSLAVAGQATTDPSGSIGVAQTLKAGSASDTSTRYGDYFGAGLDPTDTSVLWVAGEYHSSTGGTCGSFGSCWSTFIGSISTSINMPSAGGRWAR